MKKIKIKSFILDSFAVLSFLQGEKGSSHVEKLLNDYAHGEVELFVCNINLGEVYYKFIREYGLTIANHFLYSIKSLELKQVECTEARILEAATYKAKGGISYGDSFILQAAKEFTAKIVTGDSEFEKYEDDFEIIWI